MNLNMPEYSWAQGLIVASHPLRYVYCGNPSCDSISLAAAAEQLDAIRRTHNLTMIPSSDYYMATCRVLHSVDVQGPTADSGWKRYVAGQPFVVSRNIINVGDSGTEICGSSGKSHHSIVADLRTHCGYPNIHNLTEVGAHPRRWTELLVQWKNQSLHYALPKSGKPGVPAYFGSDFVVIVVDAHNGLQLGNNYTGLKHKTPTGKTVFRGIPRLL
jgi:hypothetical protein